MSRRSASSPCERGPVVDQDGSVVGPDPCAAGPGGRTWTPRGSTRADTARWDRRLLRCKRWREGSSVGSPGAAEQCREHLGRRRGGRHGLVLYSAASWGGVVPVKFLLRQQRGRLSAGDHHAYVNSSSSRDRLPPAYGSIAHCEPFSP